MNEEEVMEYTVNKLSKLSGVSARTLRYYDEIGLLTPLKVVESGYRIYGSHELDVLQQILLYRELDFPLEEIKQILQSSDFDRQTAFLTHLSKLEAKRTRLDLLINSVQKSIAEMKGEIIMKDKEKFEGFKKSLIDENERKYGKEIREKFGEKTVDESNAALMGMTKEQYDEGERLREECETTLKLAFETGDPTSELSQKACDLHRQWLSFYAPNYSKEFHKNLGEMYVTDERFSAYYEKIAAGCAKFLRDAINVYCAD
jgi:DNA-binding transcriptional MerR regulator